MKYERLTTKDEEGNWTIWEDDYSHPFEALQVAIERLSELEDDLESGKIIRLPCKVGDTVYEVFYSKYEARILEMKVIQIVMQETINYRCKTTSRCLYNYGWVKNEDFGKTVFLTREEAEAKLKELQE